MSDIIIIIITYFSYYHFFEFLAGKKLTFFLILCLDELWGEEK